MNNGHNHGGLEMRLFAGTIEKGSLISTRPGTLIAISLVLILFSGVALAATANPGIPQKTFTSPEEAVNALLAALKSGDLKELSDILGPDGKEILSSGDEVADRNGRDQFVRMLEEKQMLDRDGDSRVVLDVGKDGWPFPIPILKVGDTWRFDTKEGKQEILNRRIGRNELSAIQACLAYHDAQLEYASRHRDGRGLSDYAQKFLSEPGKNDGLYWEAGEGEEESPLGPLFVGAHKKGYAMKKKVQRASPYLGYYYKILTAQGKDAPGGAYNYLVNGKMIGGFALVAYPAEYGSSGIMTFIISHDGAVYEKDLGKNTEAVVQAMKAFNPDNTWQKVEPKFSEPHSS
jgi:hypothetical protein